MKAHRHALAGAAIGAAAAIAPDTVLALFGWRKEWLPESHPLVKAHRFLHSPSGLIWIFALAWASHVILDWFSPHRTEADRWKS